MRDRHRGRGRAHPLHPRRRGRSVQPRPHLPEGGRAADLHDDPDRLRRPLRRRGRDWEEVSWDEAFDEAAARLAAIQKAHGRDAVAVYQGNPTVHNHGSALFGQIFLRSLGTRSRFSATSVDQLPQMLASLLMFGHQLLLPVPGPRPHAATSSSSARTRWRRTAA